MFNRDVVVYHHNRYLGAHYFSQRVVHGFSIYRIMAENRTWYNVVLFAPLLAALSLCAVFLWGLAHPAGLFVVGALAALYLVAAGTAAIRTSDSLREAMLTFSAIIMSNAGYLLGSLIGLLGITIDFKKLYGNYKSVAR